jgi:SAM-dependent methyltransferase
VSSNEARFTDRSFTNRHRAESFGGSAEDYDRSRPDYPPAAIDDLVAPGPADALDIGCGTGKLGRLLAERGVSVVGVEIDERMAAVARAHGLRVEVASFESWEPAGARFDLLVAGQSWHWIDPDAGARKAAELLRPGGRLALLWNYATFDPPVRTRLEDAYLSTAPQMVESSVLLGRGPSTVPEIADRLRAAGRFAAVEHQRYPWLHRYTRDEWLALITTHSDHLVLPDAQRARVLAAVGDAIDSMGGVLIARYTTEALVASRA